MNLNLGVKVQERVCDKENDLVLKFSYKLNESDYLNKVAFICRVEKHLNYLTNKFVEDELNENIPDDILVAHDSNENENQVIEKAVDRIKASLKSLRELNVEREPFKEEFTI